MKRLAYKKDSIISRQDSSMSSLILIKSGVVVLEREIHGGPVELTRLAPGDLFGEFGVLMGAVEKARLRALTSVIVYEIAKDHLSELLHDRPVLVEELGLVLARRLDAQRDLKPDEIHIVDTHPASIATRIRHFLQVPHAVQ
jgi:CRP-like cAMP-binding protein